MNPIVPNPAQQQQPAAIAVLHPDQFLRRRVLLTLLLLVACCLSLVAQDVTEVITDYNGYWKSRQGGISPTRPDNSHNMLAFTYNGTRFSTGVNDATLTTAGDVFTPGDYRAMQVYQITSQPNSNTKIGLGAMYDGVANGPSTPRPSSNIPYYLTDGAKGLDLGTGIANLPAGEVMFAITGMNIHMIGDGIPDLVVTQIADPSGNTDSYEFTDANGVRVGNKVDVVINNAPRIGVWLADFYDANNMSLTGSFVQTERNIRMWAADFSAFGINSTNIHRVTYFRIRLNGDSDIAFVAYNARALLVDGALPTKLNSFKGTPVDQQAVLTWQTETEQHLNRFVVEASTDGQHFAPVDSVMATGFSTQTRTYNYIHRQPAAAKNWYRLKQVDENGTYEYSTIVNVSFATRESHVLKTYPNPVVSRVIMQHPRATGREYGTVRSLNGTVVMQWKPATGSIQSTIDLQSLAPGAYLLVMANGQQQQTTTILKK